MTWLDRVVMSPQEDPIVHDEAAADLVLVD